MASLTPPNIPDTKVPPTPSPYPNQVLYPHPYPNCQPTSLPKLHPIIPFSPSPNPTLVSHPYSNHSTFPSHPSNPWPCPSPPPAPYLNQGLYPQAHPSGEGDSPHSRTPYTHTSLQPQPPFFHYILTQLQPYTVWSNIILPSLQKWRIYPKSTHRNSFPYLGLHIHFNHQCRLHHYMHALSQTLHRRNKTLHSYSPVTTPLQYQGIQLNTTLIQHFQTHSPTYHIISGLENNDHWTCRKRERAEKSWIHKLGTTVPRGLNDD